MRPPRVGLIVCALLVLVSIAFTVLWIRSQSVEDAFAYVRLENPRGNLKISVFHLYSSKGRVAFAIQRRVLASTSRDARILSGLRAGLHWERLRPVDLSPGFAGFTVFQIGCSDGLVILILMGCIAGSIVRLWSQIRVWRLRRQYCVVCGYDLTGNVSGVCPECGTTISSTDFVIEK